MNNTSSKSTIYDKIRRKTALKKLLFVFFAAVMIYTGLVILLTCTIPRIFQQQTEKPLVSNKNITDESKTSIKY